MKNKKSGHRSARKIVRTYLDENKRQIKERLGLGDKILTLRSDKIKDSKTSVKGGVVAVTFQEKIDDKGALAIRLKLAQGKDGKSVGLFLAGGPSIDEKVAKANAALKGPNQ